MITGRVSGVVECDLGWVHAAELHLEDMIVDHEEFVEQRFLLAYQRLLSSKDVVGLQKLPPSGYGLWKFSDELAEEGPFPS
jgi:hypothetical protein